MSEEKLKVLEMLKENKISTEEALSLLEALKESEKEQSHSNYGNGPRPQDHHYHSDGGPRDNYTFWVDDLKENIMDSVRNIADYAINQGFDEISGGPSILYNQCFDVLPETIEAIRVIGKNGGVRVYSHADDCIVLEAKYKTKGPYDPNVSFVDEQGRYTLYYDQNSVRSMAVELKVPEKIIENLYAESKNGPVTLKGLSIGSCQAITKNSSIKASDLSVNLLSLVTRNSNIDAENIHATDMNLDTTNGKIALNLCKAATAKLVTTNATIKADNYDIPELIAKSTNGTLKFELDREALGSQHQTYFIDAQTTNSTVHVDTPFPRDIPVMLKASTTWGSIKTSFGNYHGGHQSQSASNQYLDIKSDDYDTAQKKLCVNLQTSNGSIKINGR